MTSDEWADSSEANANPYAAPRAELEQAPAAGQRIAGGYHAVSTRKLVVMMMLSCGIYQLVYWYRQWSARRSAGEDVTPWWRAVFGVFYAFPFRNMLRVELVAVQRPAHPFLEYAPVTGLVAAISQNVLDKLGAIGGPPMIVVTAFTLGVTCYCSYSFQASIDELLRAQGYTGSVNNGVSWKTVLCVIFGLCVWGALMMGALYPELTRPH